MVLLSDQIERRIGEELLIIDPKIITDKDNAPVDKKYDNLNALKNQIKPASYNIRVGKNVAIEGGKHIELKEYKKITIKPFEVAIIETYEKINMPLNMIARWNIRVKLAYKGLIWVGGPQVDPGYSGHLYCPIYNMSDKEVELQYKEPIATIDFEETTTPVEGFEGFDGDVKPFEFYRSQELKSALTTKVEEKMKEIEKVSEKMEERIHKLQTIFLTVIGALFATLSILIISMKAKEVPEIFGIITYAAIGISVTSLLMHNKDIVPLYKKGINTLGYLSLIGIISFLGYIIYETFKQ